MMPVVIFSHLYLRSYLPKMYKTSSVSPNMSTGWFSADPFVDLRYNTDSTMFEEFSKPNLTIWYR